MNPESARFIKSKIQLNSVVCFAASWYIKTFKNIPIGKLYNNYTLLQKVLDKFLYIILPL